MIQIHKQTNKASANTSKKRSKPKEHETQTVVVEGVVVDADPLLIASDDEESAYEDPLFDKDVTEDFEIRITRIRGKIFLPPKPKAPTNKSQKIEKDKSLPEAKEQAKEQKKKINENRIMTRNKKRLERENKTRVSKRARRNTEFFNVVKF